MTTVEPQELSSEQLAQRCQAGCPDSFELLVHRFAGRVHNFLFQLVRNPQDAQDLAQETFLKAYRALPHYNPAFGFTTWLFTIAKRTAASHFRATRPLAEPLDAEPIDWIDPARTLESRDESQSLWQLARRLKPRQYEALWLRYGEGFAIGDIASVLHTSPVHVKVLLHRARLQLAKKLKARSPAPYHKAQP